MRAPSDGKDLAFGIRHILAENLPFIPRRFEFYEARHCAPCRKGHRVPKSVFRTPADEEFRECESSAPAPIYQRSLKDNAFESPDRRREHTQFELNRKPC